MVLSRAFTVTESQTKNKFPENERVLLQMRERESTCLIHQEGELITLKTVLDHAHVAKGIRNHFGVGDSMKATNENMFMGLICGWYKFNGRFLL
jgi:hypothetical protein